MALAHCALSSAIFPPPSTHNSIITIKPHSFPPSLSKPPKRKNHLRLKLLKTLTKPYPTPPLPPQQIPENINEPPDYPQEIEQLPILTEGLNDEENDLNLQNIQEVQVIPEAENVITTRSVIELVFYMVGLFIVQTIITVLVMRSGGEKTENNQEVELNGKKNIKELNGEKEIKPDELQYIGKIAEIRAMAREVRERERKNSRNSSGVVEYEEDVSVPKPVVSKVKGNIEKEVDGKLSKLQRSFRSLKEKKPFISKVSNLNNPSEIKGKKNVESSNAKAKNENLVFKKKLKFKSAPFNLTQSPKGFQSDNSGNLIKGNSVSQNTADRGEANGDVILNDSSLGVRPEKEDNIHVRNSLEETISELDSEKEDNDLSSKKMGSADEFERETEKERKSSEIGEASAIDKTKSKSGIARESSSKRIEPKDTSKLRTNTSPPLTRHIERKQVVNNNGDKQAGSENDMWWLNLRYALAILLRRSSESEGPGGLYSLKMEDGSQSYLVAFEDQVDASNFCCILDAFFAELGDLIADVVPLSIQELKAELEENDLEIIVLRKGQLQLYVGQPLADVEMTLRSLMRK